jgi:putative ABC transport system ATP-binding protein
MNEHSPVISAQGLVKVYERGRVRALDGLDLTVNVADFVAIVGPSGCGKSTLLNMLAGIDRPDEGALTVAGCKVPTLSHAALDRYRAKTIGLVFQLHNLLPTLTAIENVQVPMLGQPWDGRARAERAAMLLNRVGLAGRENARATTLSGGERQRVAIARALANEPTVLLADEPTGALDSKNSAKLFDLLAELQHELRMTLVVVTHDDHVAGQARRVLDMVDGRIVGGQESTSEERINLAG